eukprot:TRINITY_DN5163_c0_g1_i1.p1 TRINITY_DN5163_c0_g1~~TRINITY_DN5163_c0_g1_i1.p1  ORF type:complete len:453 (+),score=109.53 TRINITY_DN5163_c0_g1_i1:39-1361(+)
MMLVRQATASVPRVYLDNNATTAVDPAVLREMLPFLAGPHPQTPGDVPLYGNPSSLHAFGTQLHQHVQVALDRLYAGVCADDADTLLVNSGASEGNNHVVKGVFWHLQQLARTSPNSARGREAERRNQYITSQVEHPSIAKCFDWLEQQGANVVRVPVDENGQVTPEILKKHIDPQRAALVSVMWCNNETGVVMPVRQLAAVAKEAGALFHTDATQAMGKLDVDTSPKGDAAQVDFLTFTGHKFHAPKGVGALFVRRGLASQLAPLIDGGEQLAGLRAGTIPVPNLVALGKAAELAREHLRDGTCEHVRSLRDHLEDTILALPHGSTVVGPRSMRACNTILATFPGVEGEAMLWDLDRLGVAASTGSACASESLQASPSLTAVANAAPTHFGPELAHTGVRFSLSRFTTRQEIDYAADVIAKATTRLRAISGFTPSPVRV